MYCERCREKHKWYQDVCPNCQGPLIADPPGVAVEPETPIVSVFRTAGEGLLPLATLALDQAGIEYAARTAGLSDVFGVSHPTPGFESTGSAVEIQVLEDDAERARDLLVDLEKAVPAPVAAGEASEAAGPATGRAAPVPDRVELFEGDTGLKVGMLTRTQFEWLSARLVLESPDDRDYWIDAATLEMLEGQGPDAEILHALRRALGTREGMNIGWR